MHGFEPLPGTENACAKKSGKKIRRVLGIDPGLASTDSEWSIIKTAATAW